MKQPRLIILLVGIVVVAFILWLKSFVVPYVTNLYIETDTKRLQDGTNKFVYRLPADHDQKNLNFYYHFFKHSKIEYESKNKTDPSLLYFESQIYESKSNSKDDADKKLHQAGKGNDVCDILKEEERFDCYPENGVSQQTCEARGCCWRKASRPKKHLKSKNVNETLPPLDVPYCYYPKDFPGYRVNDVTNTKLGFMALLSRNKRAYYPNDIMYLVMDVRYETDSRLRIKIYDSSKQRFEVPLDVPNVTEKAINTHYQVYGIKTGQPFNFDVYRVTADGSVPTILMKTESAAPLIFADQFIQLSYFLPSSYMYGLGEHRDRLMHNMSWSRFTLWNKDQPPVENSNLYGSHPFYMMMENDGKSHGVFLLNSNAMDVVLQPAPAITWRTIGGILDFYVFLGPTPSEVIQQYTEVIGQTFMPPYWSLGFHLCRWGYKTVNGTLAITNRNKEAGIPLDVQWNDIDYMEKKLDFTTGVEFGDQASMVNDIHSRGMHYIMIVDPGISNVQQPGTYFPYDLGMKLDIFIKDAITGKPLVGMVWPGTTVFPDFTHPSSLEYWTTVVKEFHDKVQFDGMWIDMNELSNFVPGSLTGCPNNSTLENPPYLPDVAGGSLKFTTLCATAKQYGGTQYNLHNLYGFMETKATYLALASVRQKRPFTISRSTFAGQGHFGGHWTGDNEATYHDMARSIPAILTLNMFGISVVGADICGFRSDTTEQLCQRWQQLGAFYPFSRNHNDHLRKPQDPAAFSQSMINSTRHALEIRYTLLPYLYTLIHKSHMMGHTVVRPLFFEYPKDKATYGIDTQFLWGAALMISPVLTVDTTKVDIYFPKDEWYDYYSGEKVKNTGSVQEIPAPMDKINLHMRGGYIIPTQVPGLTTTVSRQNEFVLLVYYNSTIQAEGDLFLDDGDTIDTHSKGEFTMVHFVATKNLVKSYVLHDGFKGLPTNVREIRVYGVSTNITSVHNGQKTLNFKYNNLLQILDIYNPGINLIMPFSINWK